MNPRPQLLFLCQTLPYPPDSGLAIRSFNVLRLLAREFDVTALCFARRKGGAAPRHDLEQRLAVLRQLAEVEAFPVPQEHSRWRLAWDHLRSVGLNRVYTVFTFDSRAVADRVRQLLRTRRFDLIHLDSIALSGYLPLLGEAPVVCAHPDVASFLLRRRARAARDPGRRAYLFHQAHLMEREERRWCPRFRCNIMVSDRDRMELQRIVPTARSEVVPNGVDIESFQPRDGRDEGLVFVDRKSVV